MNNYTIMKNLILAVLIVFIFQNKIYSQVTSIPIQNNAELKIKITNLPVDNVIDVIKNINQNDAVVFSNYLGEKKIKEGKFEGLLTGNYLEGIVFSNGTKFEFSEKETYLFNSGKFIYTSKSDFSGSLKQIKTYELTINNIIKTDKKLCIPEYTSISKITNSDFLLFSNYYEDYGDSIKIYNQNLNLIKGYRLNKNGFDHYITAKVGKNIIVITTPYNITNENKGFTASLIDTQNNFSIQKINFRDEIHPVRVIPIENNFALLSNEELGFFNEQGQLKWSKNIHISPMAFSTIANESENKMFLISKGAIVCIKLSDGFELWRINLKKLYPKFQEPEVIRNEYFKAYTIIDFQILNSLNVIGLLSAKIEEEYKTNTVRYSEKNLTLIDYSGEIIKHIPLSNNDDEEFRSRNKNIRWKLFQEQNRFIIINDEKILKFEL